MMKPVICAQKDTGLYKYRLNSYEVATFSAKPPTRRWSLDRRHHQAYIPQKISNEEPTKMIDRLAPIPRIFDTNSNRSIYAVSTDRSVKRQSVTKRLRPLWHSGRFIYTSLKGKQHVFHDRLTTHTCSISEGIGHQTSRRPHPARSQHFIPLSQSKYAKKEHRTLRLWRGLARVRLHRQWHQSKSDEATRALQASRQSSVIDSQPLATYPFEQNEHEILEEPRRWSFADIDHAYNNIEGCPLPFLREVGLAYTASNRSMEYASGGSRSSSRHLRVRKQRYPPWIVKVFRLVSTIIGVCCCCSPLVALALHVLDRVRLWRFRLAMHLERTHQREDLPPSQSRGYDCPDCDEDFQSRWDASSRVSSEYIRVPSSDVRSFGLGGLLKWALSPKFLADAMRAVFRSLMRTPWAQGLKKHLILAYGMALQERRRQKEAQPGSDDAGARV